MSGKHVRNYISHLGYEQRLLGCLSFPLQVVSSLEYKGFFGLNEFLLQHIREFLKKTTKMG